MARAVGSRARRTACAALAALLASEGASARLLAAERRPAFGVPAPAPAPAVPVGILSQEDFADLTSCQVAYTKLADQCEVKLGAPGEDLRAHGAPPPEVPYTLVHDADGNTIRNRATMRTINGEGELMYKAPDSNGIPSAEKGWDYGDHGDDWSGFGECGSRKFDQSPIDLPRFIGVRGQSKSVLWFDYYVDPDLTPKTKAKLVNDGHGLKFKVRPNGVDLGFLKLGGTEYRVSEYIFHGPSEHSVDGAVFPLELQVYNRPSGGRNMVAVSLFFKEGPSNPFLAALRGSMGDEAPTWTVKRGPGAGLVNGTFEGAFDLESLLPKGNAGKESMFVNYQGSLTQPPCTAGVDWWVLTKPLEASREEIRFIRRSIFAARSSRHGNARASMPIGNRSLSVGIVGFQNAVKIHRDYPGIKDRDSLEEPRGYSSGDTPWGSHWHVGDTEEPPTL